MVYVKYSAPIKLIAIRMVLAGETKDKICDTVGANFHPRTLQQWIDLYEETRMVIRDPETYWRRGGGQSFNKEDRACIRALVADQPLLFLDEIREAVYHGTGKMPCLETLHKELKDWLRLTLKKVHTSHIRKVSTRNFAIRIKCRMYQLKCWYSQVRLSPWSATAGLILLVPSSSDESAICERDLMRVYGRSPAGEQVTHWIKRSNPKRFSIIPAIALNRLLALTVREGTINRERFENFLEFQLVCLVCSYISLISPCWILVAVTFNESLSSSEQHPGHGQHPNTSWRTHIWALWCSR